MLDFRKHRGPRTYLTRPQQGWVLLLILSVGGMLILASQWPRVQQWRWFRDAQSDGQAGGADARPIDTRAKSKAPSEEIPGTFHAPAAPEAKSAPRRPPVAGARPGLLDAVRDDTRFRAEEQPAWFHLLHVLDTTDEVTLQQTSTGRVAFAQLYQQPKEYRGELVTVRGTIRGVYPAGIAKNEFGLERYYQVWLSPADNPSSAIVVYCLHLPKELPTGEPMAEQAQITGFFFKRWLYEAKDAMRLAPVLLARTIRWEPQPELAEPDPPSATTVALILGLVVALSGAVAALLYLRTRPNRPAEPSAPPSFEGLSDVDRRSDVGKPADTSSHQK